MVKGLTEEDNIVFLLSGGGSSLFEKPVSGITLEDIQEVTQQCLNCGASITEINKKKAVRCERREVCRILCTG